MSPRKGWHLIFLAMKNDESDVVIFYAEERENSGAYKAYKYAKGKKEKYIVNLWSPTAPYGQCF